MKDVKKDWLYLLAIIGITIGIYAQVVTFDLVYFDDKIIFILNKSFFTTDFSFKTIFTTDAFFSNQSVVYRPLQNLSFALDGLIAGDLYPWMLHLTNLILFIITGISLYFFLLKFKTTPHFAFLGTLLFISNPLNTWSVAWIPARGDLLLTIFTLLSFICFINFLKSSKYKDLGLTLICFSWALFSKETAAMIPLFFLLYFVIMSSENTENRNIFKKINFKHILLAGGMLCVGIVWYYLRYQSISTNKALIGNDIAYNLQIFLAALSQIIVPYEMSPYPAITLTKNILGTIILMALLFYFLKKSERKWETMFFLLWFFLFLFPTMLFKTEYIDYLEHRFLLPQIGILIILLNILYRLFNTWHRLPHSKYLIYLVIFIFSITSFIKARTLQNVLTVTEAVEKYQGIPVVPYENRANYYLEKGNYDLVYQDCNKLFRLDPNSTAAFNNIAKINMLYRRYHEAIALFNKSLSIRVEGNEIYDMRAIAKTGISDFEGALLDLDSAIMHDKNAPLLYNSRGVLKVTLGRLREALLDFDKAEALSTTKKYCGIYGNRAIARYKLEEFGNALQDCNKALQIEPDNKKLLALKDSILIRINLLQFDEIHK